mmetsp:Transcript_72990/g.193983  ORF Transcript_72990/g.193983 Transcript_72990/m.193983 type:complete len:343 (+) Transcript_72990:598-1626(+)
MNSSPHRPVSNARPTTSCGSHSSPLRRGCPHTSFRSVGWSWCRPFLVAGLHGLQLAEHVSGAWRTRRRRRTVTSVSHDSSVTRLPELNRMRCYAHLVRTSVRSIAWSLIRSSFALAGLSSIIKRLSHHRDRAGSQPIKARRATLGRHVRHRATQRRSRTGANVTSERSSIPRGAILAPARHGLRLVSNPRAAFDRPRHLVGLVPMLHQNLREAMQLQGEHVAVGDALHRCRRFAACSSCVDRAEERALAKKVVVAQPHEHLGLFRVILVLPNLDDPAVDDIERGVRVTLNDNFLLWCIHLWLKFLQQLQHGLHRELLVVKDGAFEEEGAVEMNMKLNAHVRR